MFTTDGKTGKQHYLADSGELSSSPASTFRPPCAHLPSGWSASPALESRLFQAFTEHLPPEGTPTTIVLKPVVAASGYMLTRPADSDANAKPVDGNVLRHNILVRILNTDIVTRQLPQLLSGAGFHGHHAATNP